MNVYSVYTAAPFEGADMESFRVFRDRAAAVEYVMELTEAPGAKYYEVILEPMELR